MRCRHCGTPTSHVLIDLINQPPSNSFLTEGQLDEPEVYYPLKIFVCPNCYLVQVDEYKKSQDIFSDEYIYFSSYSSSWVAHAKAYVDMAVDRFKLTGTSLVMEIASNDGYLLQHCVEKGIPCLGIEPTGGTADAAEEKGVPTIREFFSEELALQLTEKGQKADLLLGNNVLAHVPDINGFVKGLKVALNESGVITMEFPHLMNLIEQKQFDTIYHEHFSYLSLSSVRTIFSAHGLTIFDVERIPTHGGSLRVYACHSEREVQIEAAVNGLIAEEAEKGLQGLSYYEGFQDQANTVKSNLLSFLISQKKDRKTVAAYGAAAKGNTLLNYCGIKNDLVSFCVDVSPHKQGLFMPGSHIPVLAPDALKEEQPDFVLILPWNIKDEVVKQHAYIADWGGHFVTAIPELKIH